MLTTEKNRLGISPKVVHKDIQKHIDWLQARLEEAVLYMSTLSASRFNPVISSFYRRLIEAGKKPKVALTDNAAAT